MELMGTCDINGYITITIYGNIYIYIHNTWEYETISGNTYIYIYIWETVGILKN